MDEILVGARASPLSRAQFQELERLLPSLSFRPLFVETTGDLDQKTSLRTLDKTDFFTKEIDALLLSGACRIAVHSAKDLPDPLPKGIHMAALTRGVDSSDSLVLHPGQSLETLKANPLIATSSAKRELAVSALLPQAQFCDIRGTIGKRLEKLQSGSIDGIVIAEAALIRLGLTHLNRIKLPGTSTQLQGQLAILARTNDQPMQELFAPFDVRRLPKALYFGPDLPLHEFQDRWLHHYPLLRVISFSPDPKSYQYWKKATHVILTSKNSVKTLLHHLNQLGIPIESFKEKIAIAVGKATASLLPECKKIWIAEQETQEGVIKILQSIHSPSFVYFYPHSALARPLIDREIASHQHVSFDAYTLESDPLTQLPDLTQFPEAIFSSPSTVEAFFAKKPKIPPTLQLTPIGPVTREALAKFTSLAQTEKKSQQEKIYVS